jgi:hypothetical protein
MDDDFDGFVYASDSITSIAEIYYIELNKLNCHVNCDGCFKPNNELECLRCKTGFRLIQGKCVAKSIPCPNYLKENRLGECQGCALNDPTKNNCLSCDLSIDNLCSKCGPFLNLDDLEEVVPP